MQEKKAKSLRIAKALDSLKKSVASHLNLLYKATILATIYLLNVL